MYTTSHRSTGGRPPSSEQQGFRPPRHRLCTWQLALDHRTIIVALGDEILEWQMLPRAHQAGVAPGDVDRVVAQEEAARKALERARTPIARPLPGDAESAVERRLAGRGRRQDADVVVVAVSSNCLLYTSPSPRDS